MAHLPEGQAQFEYTKMQLIGSLGAVAETMRNCATFAEQFAQLIAPVTYPGAPVIFPNGQLPQMPPPHIEPTGGKRKARGGEDGEGKRKRKSKPKDPNAPKRPPSSYLLFQNEVRQELKIKYPNMSNNELLAKISKIWSEMPKEKKDRYEARQAVAKTHYEEQKKQYQQSLAGDAAAPAAGAVDPAIIAGAPASVDTPAGATSEEEDNEEDNEKDEDGNDESSSSGSSEEDEQETAEPPVKKSKQELRLKAEGKKEKKKTKV